MPRLPVLSGRELLRALERPGFAEVSQRGSHVKLRRGSVTVIVTNHREVKRGTLVAILQQGAIPIDDLLSALAH